VGADVPTPSEAVVDGMLATLAAVTGGNLKARMPVVGAEHGPLARLAAAIGGVIDAWRSAEKKARQAKRDLEGKLATIEAQAVAIRELSTPVLEIWDDVLLVPVVGVLDRRFGRELVETLLPRIAKSQATHVIVDITGVEVVDTETAGHLSKLVRAAAFLGAECILTGTRPAVAETLVQMSADLAGVQTLGTLREGLQACFRTSGEGDRRGDRALRE